MKPFYNPPTLIAKQALSALYFGFLAHWEKLPYWLSRGKKTLPTAAGAIGMGCIGFPIHPVWEITNACNLRCKQCHAGSGKPLPNELSTEEGKRLLSDIATVDQFRMLALSGGEPLIRKDITELIHYARSLGFEISIATNGTLLSAEMAREFKRMGVANIAIGLNANDEKIHEGITRVAGSFEKTKRAIYATVEAGMNLQINTTVMEENREAIPGLLDFASEVKAEIVLLYHLVPEGRGDEQMELDISSYKEVLEMVRQEQRANRSIIEPVCSPQYWPYLISHNGNKPSKVTMKLAETVFKGCIAGSGLCYIKPNGDIWPCPFVPVIGGNIRRTPLKEIWQNSEVFATLRDRANLKGRCAGCKYRNICGGCRGRAYAHYADYLAEDPLCFLHAKQAEV